MEITTETVTMAEIGEEKNVSRFSPGSLTPEEIERRRKVREERKAKKLLAKKNEKPDPKLEFIRRPMLDIPDQKAGDGLVVSIMAYNVLAQALIRRKLFPTSGEALKWGNRSQVLFSEFKHYDSDIMCLQELDFIQYNSFWKPEFKKLGYSSEYYRADDKNHGVAIFYKKTMFQAKHSRYINYDKVDTGDVKSSTETRNVGILVNLEFSEEVIKNNPTLSRSGIIVGTTHLFWHPYGTAERTRQTYIVLQQMKEFTRTLNLLNGEDKKYYRFFAGDFNSQPFDSPYLSVVAKPITYTNRAKNVLGRSLAHKWQKNEKEEECGDNDENKDEDKEVNQENDEDQSDSDEEDSPVPSNFKFSTEILEKIDDLEKLHNDLDMRAISLYSVGYSSVHKENAGRDNDRNEPFFSNWAHTWRGLLDYIFVVTDWDKQESFADKIDLLRELKEESDVKLLGLLRLPEPEEMGEEPSGQPRTGQYPSDHLCIIAKIELC